jgi:hypothetical protein
MAELAQHPHRSGDFPFDHVQHRLTCALARSDDAVGSAVERLLPTPLDALIMTVFVGGKGTRQLFCSHAVWRVFPLFVINDIQMTFQTGKRHQFREQTPAKILKSWLGQTNRGRRAHGKPVSIARRPHGNRDKKRLRV